MLDWQQDYVCWKCRERIVCQQDVAAMWAWPRSDEVREFERKHASCDDGKSVAMTLTIFPEIGA